MPPRARADFDAVELALTNLVENAVVHAGPGCVEVTVGPAAEVSVRDRGKGLPPGVGNRLFEPFWRSEDAPAGGSGLGLAIVERLQRAQGGQVEARPADGGGAKFTLSFRSAETVSEQG
jgi:two-component system OmpR family sensor kinase